MKLRKALDKSQLDKAQLDGPQENPHHNVVVKPQLFIRKQPHHILWQPPTYTQSKAAQLDKQIVEQNRGVCIGSDPKKTEPYKILKTRIHQMGKKRKLNTLMVTSARKQEGKTVTCLNMGMTFAKDLEQTVLLVDCDFNGQNLHKYLGVTSQRSLVDFFLDHVPLSELIVWPGLEKLTMISGEKTVSDASELLSSEMMHHLVQEMGTRYDDRYVFFDTPPVLDRSEAIAMAPMVDGIIMVVEAGVTSKKDVIQALRLLPREKFLGFVFNKRWA